MATYLVIKNNDGIKKSYECRSTHTANPYLVVNKTNYVNLKNAGIQTVTMTNTITSGYSGKIQTETILAYSGISSMSTSSSTYSYTATSLSNKTNSEESTYSFNTWSWWTFAYRSYGTETTFYRPVTDDKRTISSYSNDAVSSTISGNQYLYSIPISASHSDNGVTQFYQTTNNIRFSGAGISCNFIVNQISNSTFNLNTTASLYNTFGGLITTISVTFNNSNTNMMMITANQTINSTSRLPTFYLFSTLTSKQVTGRIYTLEKYMQTIITDTQIQTSWIFTEDFAGTYSSGLTTIQTSSSITNINLSSTTALTSAQTYTTTSNL